MSLCWEPGMGIVHMSCLHHACNGPFLGCLSAALCVVFIWSDRAEFWGSQYAQLF